MNIIFFGSPSYTIPIVEQIKYLNYHLMGIVTQNIKKGKRNQMVKTSICVYAEKNKIKVFTPPKLGDSVFLKGIKELDSDLIIIFAYGKILPSELIKIPKYGCLNIHASILPKWRGAAPIQRALLNGDKKTGITFFKVNSELDKGDIISIRELNISDNDDNLTLQSKLSKLAVTYLQEAIDKVVNDSVFLKQNESESSYAKKICKKESLIKIVKFGYSETRMVPIYSFCKWLQKKLKNNPEYLIN